MITQEEWMDLLSYRQMAASGATWAEIARLAGCDWRTARKYLSRERAWADLARLHALLLELGRLAEGVGALAAHLDDALVVSYHSGDFDEAEQARQTLAAVGALCAVLRRTAGDAQAHLAGVDPGLPGLVTSDGLWLRSTTYTRDAHRHP